MLMPKRVKYRKNHLPHIKGKETRGLKLAFATTVYRQLVVAMLIRA